MKMIQVFLKTGQGRAEVSGELIKKRMTDDGVWITSTEGKHLTIHFFPHENIDFIRIWSESDED